MKIFLTTILLLTIPCFSQAKTLSKDELLKIGANQVECTIVSVGSYNFLATGPDGKEINFNTDDSSIQFVPENERLLVGDRVSVIYIEALSPSQSKDKTHAQLVEWIEKAPRVFLNGDITCTLTPLKYRGGRTCYVESINQVIRFEGTAGWDSSLVEGNKISVNLKAVPASIGNGYIYKGAQMSLVN